MKPLFCILLLIFGSLSQNPEANQLGNQNYIQPTVVNHQNQIPAQQVHHTNQNPTPNTHDNSVPPQVANPNANNTESQNMHTQSQTNPSTQNIQASQNNQDTQNNQAPQNTQNAAHTQNLNNQHAQNNNAQQQVLQSNVDMHGLQGQAIPVNNDPNQHNNAQNQNHNQSGSPRTQQQIDQARQKADRARQMAEQARRQAEQDQKNIQQQLDQQLQRVQYDSSISLTERKKQQQRLNFKKMARQVQSGTRFTEYLFQQSSGASQFFVKIPAAQQVAINLYTYIAQDNTYVRTKNIQQQQPVRVTIYQNNQRAIHDSEFYFQSYIIFQGQAKAMYLIRIYNSGRSKLISMNVKKMVEDAHIQTTLQKHDGGHVQKTQNLAVQINRWYQQFRKIRMLDYQDIKAVQGYIQKYYSWQIVQTILAVILCAFQVSLIGNMLKGTSIV